MKKANNDIRVFANKSGVLLWQVAAKLGMNDGNFSRLLRFELPEEKKTEIMNIIDKLTRE